MGFVVDKATLEQVFSVYFDSPANLNPINCCIRISQSFYHRQVVSIQTVSLNNQPKDMCGLSVEFSKSVRIVLYKQTLNFLSVKPPSQLI
jgi:hypothetical protein